MRRQLPDEQHAEHADEKRADAAQAALLEAIAEPKEQQDGDDDGRSAWRAKKERVESVETKARDKDVEEAAGVGNGNQ